MRASVFPDTFGPHAPYLLGSFVLCFTRSCAGLAAFGGVPGWVGQPGKPIDYQSLDNEQQHGYLDDDEFSRPPDDPERNDQRRGSRWRMADFE